VTPGHSPAGRIAAANSEAFPVAGLALGSISPGMRTGLAGGPAGGSGALSPGDSASPVRHARAIAEGKEAEMPEAHGAAGSPGESPRLRAAAAARAHESKEDEHHGHGASPRSIAAAAAAAAARAAAGGLPPPTSVPSFYTPGEGGRGRGRANAADKLEASLPAILDLFRRHNAAPAVPLPAGRPGGAVVSVAGVELSWEDAHTGLPVEHFPAVAKTLCGFPSFFAAPLFRRIRAQFVLPGASNTGGRPVGFSGTCDGVVPVPPAGAPSPTGRAPLAVRVEEAPAAGDDPADRDTTGLVPLVLFLQFWRTEVEPYDGTERFFRLVKRRAARVIEAPDFTPLLEELLAFHPGLGFLESAPEFQEKYARTVIARIFYVCDPTARRAIDLRQLRRSNVLKAFHTVDVEEDINVVNDYFSYEHFYVLYCKFWELDSDHDFLLSRADLGKMTDLTNIVLDRAFAAAAVV